ncbi:MAG: hypothetical protein EU535_08260 [Promethearchaeota archaeon]|nr:MAG: hypothetical protein EU535_08260 [Candidatus Lokiarchaeota archaeon]
METLGNYKGDDGLRISDFPEMKIENGEVTFKKIPTMLNVRSDLSKAGNKYFSFLSEEGCEYLKAYLEERLRNDEKLDKDTDIITPKWASKQFVRTINIGDSIRNSIRGAGYKWRPYVLRAYFDTQLLLAESKGKMNASYRKFLLGHTGNDIEARYTTNKGRLNKELIEDMRENYKKSQVYLQTIQTEDEEEELAIFTKRVLQIFGATPEEMEALDPTEMDEKDLVDFMRKKLIKSLNENKPKIISVELSEFDDYVNKGYDYVDQLSNGKVVFRLPLQPR